MRTKVRLSYGLVKSRRALRNLPLVERGCTSKARYLSRREAKSLKRHGRHQDGSVRPYRCRYCEWWHLGH